MFRLKVQLRPMKRVAININYRPRLNALCKELIQFNRKRYPTFTEEKKQKDKLFFSPLFCKKYEVHEGKIIFKDSISCYISCPSYSTVLDLVQGFYHKNIIKLGRVDMEVVSIELKSIENYKRSEKPKKHIYNEEHTMINYSTVNGDEVALMK
ncbi:MAG: hypothetical protein GX895_05525 [Clostridiales bacterium]|uniref:hypothetical protein n=1 Tax=Clostridium sp. N3C TaxID=1776758 RepID=UPI00092DEDA1|nr:hypothetical protein [Clostridium sp. N3C]NLZ48241.1 hypothetical protein [Clostridiales bacterium]SCN22267.1 putative protein predicted to be involved in DNA repair (RAMP superfamily) [Clostridium sp. N3C]